MENNRTGPRGGRSQKSLWIAGVALATLLIALAVVSSTGKPDELVMPKTRPALAINGYDPLAYFDGSAAAGSPDHAFMWNDQEWRFASAQHKERFVVSPETYAPAFEGKCAFAMSLGKVADASPTNWVIENNRLYLQQNAVARLLFKTLPGRAAKAEHNWTRVRRT